MLTLAGPMSYGLPGSRRPVSSFDEKTIAPSWSNPTAQPGENQETGWGGGGGLTARPVGAFLIKGDEVTWRPAVDVDRMILVGQIVGAIAVLTLGATLRALIRRR